MARLSAKERARYDAKRIQNDTEARRLCSAGATGWDAVVRTVKLRDRDQPCYRCGHPMDWSASPNSPQGVTIDHIGTQVADTIGMVRKDARKLLHDASQLRLSHRECNSRDGKGPQRPPTGAAFKPLPIAAPKKDDRTPQQRFPSPWAWDHKKRSEIGDAILGMGNFKSATDDERKSRVRELMEDPIANIPLIGAS